MGTKLDIYVNYPGHCEEAFQFYEKHLGGKITIMLNHKDAPGILHARIDIGNTTIMGADVSHAEPMRSAYLTLRFDNSENAERIYALLSDGGEIFMKMEKTFYAHLFAMLRDKFGTSWMLLHED